MGYLMRSAPKIMPRKARPRAQARSCGQSGLSSWLWSVPMRTTSPFLTRALLKPLEPQSAQQLQGIHVPGSSSVPSPVSARSVWSKPAHPVVPRAAVPMAVRPVHFRRPRRVIPPLTRTSLFAPSFMHLFLSLFLRRRSVVFRARILGARPAETQGRRILYIRFH